MVSGFGKRIEEVVERTLGQENRKVEFETSRIPEERLAGRPHGPLKIAIGSDHRGYVLKKQVGEYLRELGHMVVDCGTKDGSVADYPDIALAVCEKVARQVCDLGILVDAVGIGSAIAANKVAGIRAATCHDIESARSSRLHNDANVISLGSNIVNRGLARRMIRTWLETAFEGGRHVQRIEKIARIEKEGLDARL